MQLPWTQRDQRHFDFLIAVVASVNRLLPAPVSRFPFNAGLQDLRLQMMRDRLMQVRLGVTPRSVRKTKSFLIPNGPWCYRPRYLNIQRLNYLWTIRHSSARIAGNLIT